MWIWGIFLSWSLVIGLQGEIEPFPWRLVYSSWSVISVIWSQFMPSCSEWSWYIRVQQSKFSLPFCFPLSDNREFPKNSPNRFLLPLFWQSGFINPPGSNLGRTAKFSSYSTSSRMNFTYQQKVTWIHMLISPSVRFWKSLFIYSLFISFHNFRQVNSISAQLPHF